MYKNAYPIDSYFCRGIQMVIDHDLGSVCGCAALANDLWNPGLLNDHFENICSEKAEFLICHEHEGSLMETALLYVN